MAVLDKGYHPPDLALDIRGCGLQLGARQAPLLCQVLALTLIRLDGARYYVGCEPLVA